MIGVPDDTWVQSVKAIVVTADGRDRRRGRDHRVVPRAHRVVQEAAHGRVRRRAPPRRVLRRLRRARRAVRRRQLPRRRHPQRLTDPEPEADIARSSAWNAERFAALSVQRVHSEPVQNGRHEQERVQDLRPPRRVRRPPHGHRLVLRHRRPVHRPRHRARLRRRLVLVQRHPRGQGRGRAAGHRGGGARALRHRPRPRPAQRHADAARLHLPGGRSPTRSPPAAARTTPSSR